METVGEENFQTVLFVYIREKKKTFVLLFMCHESIHFFNFKYTVC